MAGGVEIGVEIGLGRGITGDDKGHEDTVREVDGCGPKIEIIQLIKLNLRNLIQKIYLLDIM